MSAGAARFLVLALAACVLGGAAAGPAGAHAYLIETTPPNEAVVPSSPAEVRLVFTEPVDLGPNALQLLDANGVRLKAGSAAHVPGNPRAAALKLPPGLGRGTYVIAWRVVGIDSHPVSGGFSFSVGAPSAVVSAGGRQTSQAVGFVDWVSRGAAFGGFALTIGGAFLLLGIWPEGRASRRGRRLVWSGVGTLFASSLLLLLLQGPYASGASLLGIFRPSLIDFSLGTRFGHALVLRLVLTAAFAGLVALALSGRLRGAAVAIPGAACAVGLAATWTLSDHSRTGLQPRLGVPVASLHLLSMALWLGGLTVLLACVLGRRTEQPGTLVPVLPRFSRLGLACFATLGATGLYLAWRQVGTLPALPATTFGKLLLVKGGIVLTIVALAALSRRAVGRGALDGIAGLRRTVTGEAILGVAVLAITATLVNAAPARTSYAPPADVTVPVPVDAASALAGGTVEVLVKPARQGGNVGDIYLVGSDGLLFSASEVTGRLAPPNGAEAREVAISPAEPGHYVAATLAAPYPGRWTLRLVIDGDRIDVPVEIR